MAVNSHIQIPNCILKNFRSPQSGKVFFLNLDTEHIGACGSANLGAEFGYYSDAMEEYLNAEIEAPISRLAAEVISFLAEKKEKLVLPISAEESLKKYITAAMARSQFALDVFMRKSVTADFVDMQTNHDDLVLLSTLRGIHSSIQGHKMMGIINCTTHQFVVPRNCFYTVTRENSKTTWIIAPISPLFALALAPAEYTGCCADGEEGRLFQVNDDRVIHGMNVQALTYEYAFNKSFVASADRLELVSLKEHLAEKHDLLDLLKKDMLM